MLVLGLLTNCGEKLVRRACIVAQKFTLILYAILAGFAGTMEKGGLPWLLLLMSIIVTIYYGVIERITTVKSHEKPNKSNFVEL